MMSSHMNGRKKACCVKWACFLGSFVSGWILRFFLSCVVCVSTGRGRAVSYLYDSQCNNDNTNTSLLQQVQDDCKDWSLRMASVLGWHNPASFVSSL